MNSKRQISKFHPDFLITPGHFFLDAGFTRDQIRCEIMLQAPFFQSILEKAKAEDFGTIVIGRRRLTPLKRRTFGRVGSNIFKHADDHVVWIVQ